MEIVALAGLLKFSTRAHMETVARELKLWRVIVLY
jgi:hypothetical protein